MAPDSDKIMQLDPATILAEGNTRYSLNKTSVDEMRESIKAMGGITTPVSVEALDKPVNGKKYRLVVGFRRHAAALALNTDEGAGLKIPAQLVNLGDPVMRLRYQLSENIDRKTLSPMDQAVAIKQLMDAGVTRLQVRDQFKRPGGKKGTEMTPASNAWLNMTLSFLDLPKPIRDKIHSGAVGVAAAYELTKVSPEKQEEVLAKAEEQRTKELERESKEEERYLKAESKVQEAVKEVEETTTKLDHAKAEVELAEKDLAEKQEAAAVAYKASRTAKEADAKRKATEHFKALEADAKGVEKRLTTAKKELDKLTEVQTKVEDKAKGLREQLEAARAAGGGRKGKVGRAKGTAVGPQDVKKGAAAAGASSEHVKLTASEMRKTIEDLTLAGTYPKVAAIGAAIKSCFDGAATPGQMLKALAAITGEGKKK